jgi:FtsH-binding integral membrane protein
MYSFFYFSTSLTGDTIAQFGLTLVFLIFMFALWRRISPRRDFALYVVGAMVAVSGGAFLLWLLAYALSGWNPLVAIIGTPVLGLAGILVGLPSLNALARANDDLNDLNAKTQR